MNDNDYKSCVIHNNKSSKIYDRDFLEYAIKLAHYMNVDISECFDEVLEMAEN